MKKIAKVLSVILCAALVLGMLYLAIAFLGNPVSYILTKRSAKQYMEENFSESDFKTSAVGYNFKTGDYYVNVDSPSSIDSHFTVYFDGWGRYRYDTYESVTSLSNTISRLDSEYRKLVKSKLYEGNGTLNSGIAFGELRIADIYEVHTYTKEDGTTEYYTLDKEYGLDRATLELDGQYDIRELGRSSGHIVLYLYDEEVSVERTAELLLEVKAYLDENNIPFHALKFNLYAPKNELGQTVGDHIILFDFLYSDIYEKGLADRVQEHWDIAREHFAIQDGLKKEKELISSTLEINIP